MKQLCCKVCYRWWEARTGFRSGGDLEQLGNEGGLSQDVAPANFPNLPLPVHRHRLVARQWVPLQTRARDIKGWGAAPSGCSLEEIGNQGGLRLHVATTNPVNLPLPDHRHRLEAGQRPSRCAQAAEAEPRSYHPLDPAVILLDDVVQVLALAAAGSAKVRHLASCPPQRVGRPGSCPP